MCLWSVGVWLWSVGLECVGMYVGVERGAIVTLDNERSVDSLQVCRGVCVGWNVGVMWGVGCVLVYGGTIRRKYCDYLLVVGGCTNSVHV